MANKEKEKSESETDKLKNEVDASAKMFDVAGPGKTPALATSRPIIVKHGSMLQHDPMVVKDDEKPSAPGPAKDAPAHELKIKPDASATEAEAEPEASAPKEEESSQAEESDQNEDVGTEDSNEANDSSGSGAVDTLANEVDAKQANKKAKKELEERTRELEKSIESKEFFVPIGVASHRRSVRRSIGIFILFIILGLVALNFAIDAEVLDVGVQALTDLL